MRKFWVWAGIFALLTGAAVGLCIWLNGGVPTAGVGELPTAVAEQSHVLTGWQESPEGIFELRMPPALRGEELELVLCEMSAFSLSCNGELLYQYDPGDGYKRIHTVPLPLSAGGTYQLQLKTPQIVGRNRILLATPSPSRQTYELAFGVNMATIGAFLLTIFYSLTLFFQKRSEKYLLLLAGLSVVALISAFSNSVLSLPGIGNISEPVRFFRVTFCAALCPILLNTELPGRWKKLYAWPCILGVTLVLYALYRLGLQGVSSELSYLLAIPAGLACADGCARREPFAKGFMFSVAIREALRIYYRLIQAGVLVCPPIFFHYYIPQFSSFLFVLGCILLINGRFAQKFREVDLLAAGLEEANAHLDAKVAMRTRDLQLANEQLRTEQERKHRIMLNIFHDLRTPIFAALGSAERVRPADEASARNLSVLEERLDFLRHMSEELFFQAKLEEGKITFERFRIRLDDFCPLIARSFEVMAEKKGLRFSFRLEEGLLVTGDSYRLKQALENLLSNALKYTNQGGVSLTVRSEGGEALFEVRDTGPGIAPEDLPNIFDRYYQGKLSRGPESAGLGLSIAQAIARAHDGAIEVESRLGEGSRFTLRLPLEREDEGE